MILHNILQAIYIEPNNSAAHMIVDATIDGMRDIHMNFVYRPSDIHGLSNDVTAWLMSNPEFQIQPHDPNWGDEINGI